MLFPVAEISKYLVEEEIVRDPNVAGQLPAVWVRTVNGAPYGPEMSGVGQSDPCLYVTTSAGPGAGPYEEFLKVDVVELTIRGSNAATCEELAVNIDNTIAGVTNQLVGDLQICIIERYVGWWEYPTTQDIPGFVFKASYWCYYRQEAQNV